MGRAARALLLHELQERVRDKWVISTSLLFAVLACAVALYGESAGKNAVGLTGPSLVTLISLFVPLVALILSHDSIVGEKERNTLGLLLSLPISRFEVVLAKFLGRGIALVCAVGVGMGLAALATGKAARLVFLPLLGPTLLLGLTFLSIGLLLSILVRHQTTAASLTVVVWFGLVFFYDLGLLGVLVLSKGALSQETIHTLVLSNPAGLFRIQMMGNFAGAGVLEKLGMTTSLPTLATLVMLWSAWLLGTLSLSGLLFWKKKVI